MSTFAELEERWRGHYYARWHKWRGFRLPQREMKKKGHKVRTRLMRGIYPRGRAIRRMVELSFKPSKCIATHPHQ
ncbi:hypothetical protein ZL58_14100 [Salmonella enterica subsp. enterica serovar Typhimurium]|nr:hypothetical protein [Salmonella enterica subsp. enterica serovar Typhimurium]